MSNKNKNHSKKWLITRLKTSGSKRERVISADYADTRNNKKPTDLDLLPSHESFGKSFKFYNGKINYELLIRFLRGKTGRNWNDVQMEIHDRIPKDLILYKDCVKWFVADLVELREDKFWDKREQKFLRLDNSEFYTWQNSYPKEFYVHPETNLLMRVPDFPSQRMTKNLEKDALRKFREVEKNKKLETKNEKISENEKSAKLASEILKVKKSASIQPKHFSSKADME